MLACDAKHEVADGLARLVQVGLGSLMALFALADGAQQAVHLGTSDIRHLAEVWEVDGRLARQEARASSLSRRGMRHRLHANHQLGYRLELFQRRPRTTVPRGALLGRHKLLLPAADA